MKTRSRDFTQTLSALLVTSLLGTFAVVAADPKPDAPKAAAPADRGQGGPGGMRGGMLDEKQRDVLREAGQSHRDEMRKLDEQMRTAQKELMQAMMAEKQDEKVIREKAEAVAKIQVEQTMLRAKIFAAVVPTLRPEQREQMEENPWILNMLGGGFGGMRGGMDRGGQPGGDRGRGDRGDRPPRN